MKKFRAKKTRKSFLESCMLLIGILWCSLFSNPLFAVLTVSSNAAAIAPNQTTLVTFALTQTGGFNGQAGLEIALSGNLSRDRFVCPARVLSQANANCQLINCTSPVNSPGCCVHMDAATTNGAALNANCSIEYKAMVVAPPGNYGHELFGLCRENGQLVNCTGDLKPLTVKRFKSITGNLTGSWWNPSRSGEGFFLDVSTVGGRKVLLASWFTYLGGKQQYLVGSADVGVGEAFVELDMISTRGANFGSQFQANQVQRIPWGTVRLEFFGCNDMLVIYNGNGQSGTIEQQRLVGNLSEVGCE
jgi:hypothetical protein